VSGEERTRLTNYTQVSYDVENGELVTVEDIFGSTTRDIVRVRQELQEKVLRQAVIYELEREGYTVLSPEPPDGTEERGEA
jgi:hypothetical protein